MGFKQRILKGVAYALVSCMLCSFVPIAYAQEEAVSEETKTESVAFTDPEYEVLKYADVLLGFEEYTADAMITKGAYLKMLMRACGVGDTAWQGDTMLFYDVKEDSEYFSVVSAAYAQGIVQGHNDGTLGIQDKITKDEAVVMALRALGYEEIAKAAGGFPTGYHVTAVKTGLTDGVKDQDGFLTLDQAIVLLYNMMNTELVKTVGDGASKIDAGSSFMHQVFDIYTAEGVVQENGFSNLYTGERNEKSEMIIGDVRYKTDSRYADSYLGYHVKVHYEIKDEERYIIHLDTQSNKVMTLDTEDVNEVLPTCIRYYKNGDRELSLSTDVILLQNGQIQPLLEDGLAVPQNGTFEIIDHNGDGRYDVIHLMSYEIMVVSDISQGVIYDQLSGEKNIDTDAYEYVTVLNENGEEIGIEGIQRNCVLAVYKDTAKRFMKIIVSDRSLTMKVQRVFEKTVKSDRYLEIADEEGNVYRTTAEFISREGSGSIKAGVTYTFLLAPGGRIAAIRSLQSIDTMRYGYLTHWAAAEGIKKGVMLKIFTMDNQFEIFDTDDKIKVSGMEGKLTAAELLSLIKKPQLIRYRADEHVVKEIEFAGDDEEKDGLRKICSTPEGNQSYNNRYYASTGLVGGRILVNGDTGIFVVPELSDVDNEKKYSYHPCTYLTNEWYYPGAESYTDTRNSVTAKAVVVKSTTPQLKRSSPVMLVKSMGSYYNAETGDTGIEIYGFQAGNDTAFKCAEGIRPYAKVGDETEIEIAPGDAVRLILDDDGYVASFKMMFDESERKVYGVNNGDDASVVYGSETRHLYGKAYKMYDNLLKVQREGDTVPLDELFPLTGSSRIYQVDMSEKGDRRFRMIGRGDIVTMASDPNLKDNIFVHTQFEITSLVVVYKSDDNA